MVADPIAVVEYEQHVEARPVPPVRISFFGKKCWRGANERLFRGGAETCHVFPIPVEWQGLDMIKGLAPNVFKVV